MPLRARTDTAPEPEQTWDGRGQEPGEKNYGRSLTIVEALAGDRVRVRHDGLHGRVNGTMSYDSLWSGWALRPKVATAPPPAEAPPPVAEPPETKLAETAVMAKAPGGAVFDGLYTTPVDVTGVQDGIALPSQVSLPLAEQAQGPNPAPNAHAAPTPSARTVSALERIAIALENAVALFKRYASATDPIAQAALGDARDAGRLARGLANGHDACEERPIPREE